MGAASPAKGVLAKLSIASTYTTIAQVVKVGPPKMKRGTVETTIITDDWKTFMATLLEAGSVGLTIQYDAGSATHAQLWTDFQAGTAKDWKLVLTDAGAAEIAFSAITEELGWEEFEAEKKIEAALTLKITGAVTITP